MPSEVNDTPQSGFLQEEYAPTVQQAPMLDPLAGGPFTSTYSGARQDAELLRWLMDFAKELDSIEHFLRGERWEPAIQKYVERGRRRMNEEGIQDLMLRLTAFDHKGIIMGKYDQTQINRILWNLADDVGNWIRLSWHKYNIDRADFDNICDTVIRNIQAAYSRALDGGERKMLSMVNKRLENVQVIESEQRPRFRMFPFGRM